ncbi:MAG TPA: hypothetical protein VF530_01430 [Planctomycetota bacterium]
MSTGPLRRRHATWLGLVAALVAGACRGPRLEAEPLPFHLAVVPFEVLVEAEALPPGNSPEQWILTLDADEVSREACALLDGVAFSRVTLLAPPAGIEPAAFAAWPVQRREEHWLAATRAAGADLLLLAHFDLDPRVRTTVPGGAMLSGFFEGLLKYGIYGTPLNWYSGSLAVGVTLLALRRDDRRHECFASLDVALLDPRALEARAGEPASHALPLAPIRTYRMQEVSDLRQRASWFGALVSLVVPGVFLPSQERRLARSLRERIAEGLLSQLVTELALRRRELLRADGLYPFQVAELSLRATAGGHELRCAFELDTSTFDGMDGYRVWVDGAPVHEGALPEPVPVTAERARYELVLPLADLAPAALVRLELRDGAPRQHVRTFTLRADRSGRKVSRPLELELRRGDPGTAF